MDELERVLELDKQIETLFEMSADLIGRLSDDDLDRLDRGTIANRLTHVIDREHKKRGYTLFDGSRFGIRGLVRIYFGKTVGESLDAHFERILVAEGLRKGREGLS